MKKYVFIVIVIMTCCLSCNRQIQPKILIEGFVDFPEGRLLEYTSADFNWIGDNGSAEITNKKSKFSPHSLRINGGENRSVTVEPANDIGEHEIITF